MYKNLIMKSIKDVFDNYQTIGKAVVIPMILLLILNFASNSFSSEDQKISLVNIFFVFLTILVDMVILVTVHRILILGRDSVPSWGIQKFEQREFNFFLKYLIIAIVFVTVVVLTTLLLRSLGVNIFTAILVTAIILSIFLSRVSLVFPAIAVDAKMSFKESFHYTEDFKLLTFVMVIVFPVLFSIVIGGIYTFVISLLASSISAYLNLLLIVLNVTISVFLVSALSNLYMYISETLAQQNTAYDENEYTEEDQNDKIDEEEIKNEDKNSDFPDEK